MDVTGVQLDETLLKTLDFDALVVFLVVFRERNVSRAAACLGLKQPAVSNVLGKLRRQFGDPLFTRCGRGIVPTERAVALTAVLEPVIGALQETWRGCRGVSVEACSSTTERLDTGAIRYVSGGKTR